MYKSNKMKKMDLPVWEILSISVSLSVAKMHFMSFSWSQNHTIDSSSSLDYT